LAQSNKDVDFLRAANSNLSWNLDNATADLKRYTETVNEMRQKNMKDESIKDNLKTQLEALKKNNATLAEVLEAAAQGKSAALLVFTAKVSAAILSGEIEIDRVEGVAHYTVTLIDCKENRIGCIKVARELLNIGLREAKDLTDPARGPEPQPVVLARGIMREKADAWDKAFKSLINPTAQYTITRE
jgi:ribosomal protein L7/L12